MLRRLRLLTLWSLVSAAIVAFGLFWVLTSGNRINHRTYRLIHLGMTRVEVEALLRAPAGKYDIQSGKTQLVFPIETIDSDYDSAGPAEIWASRKTEILVWFDEHGKVSGKGLIIGKNFDWLERLIDWIDPPKVDFQFDGP